MRVALVAVVLFVALIAPFAIVSSSPMILERTELAGWELHTPPNVANAWSILKVGKHDQIFFSAAETDIQGRNFTVYSLQQSDAQEPPKVEVFDYDKDGSLDAMFYSGPGFRVMDLDYDGYPDFIQRQELPILIRYEGSYYEVVEDQGTPHIVVEGTKVRPEWSHYFRSIEFEIVE